jgi:hypothetical protein
MCFHAFKRNTNKCLTGSIPSLGGRLLTCSFCHLQFQSLSNAWPSQKTITSAGEISGSLSFWAFGCWLFKWRSTFLQYFFNSPRPNPFDPGTLYYGCPSEIGFYTAVAFTFVVEFTFVWNIQFSPVYWAELILFFIVPPSIIMWVGFNTWQEVLLSMGLGVGAVTLFVLAVRFYFMHELPFMLSCAPWTWFSCVDTWIQTRQGQAETEYIRRCAARIKRLVPRPTGPRVLRDSLY